MMKKILIFFSYLITFMAAAIITLAAVIYFRVSPAESKLDQLTYLIEQCFIGDYDKTKMQDAAAAAMIASLGDRWSYYIPASEYEAHVEQEENEYVGIGITITPAEEGYGFLIINLQSRGSAKEAGILVGDIILTAGGQSTEGMTVTDLRNIIRGEEGTTVNVGIRRADELLEFEVVRSRILTDVVTYTLLEDGIGLISILNFDARCAEEAINAIESLTAQGAQKLIFDVRDNPGGYADELIKLLDYLLPEGDLFRTVDYAGRETIDRSDEDYLGLPIAVICNEKSYSAAEFFTAAIQEYGAGTIIGAQTCGKGYFQYTIPLTDGSAVGLSVGKYYTPNGNSLTGIGVTPDILIGLDEETAMARDYGKLAPENDPQIQAAIEALQKE